MSGIYHKNKEWANVTEINKSGATATATLEKVTVNGTTYGVPAAPTVNNNTITIQLNGTTIESFTLNQNSDETINIQVSKSDVGLGNVPNVATDDQTPTVTEASSRANLAVGDTLKTIIGKIKKFFADLGDLAFINKDGSSSTKYLRGDGTWQTLPSGSDENVKQENTTGSADYRVLLSNGANDTTETKTARKSTNLKFNPSTGNLQATQLNGVTIGSSPKFTDTDTKVTSSENHYSPSTASGSDVTASASGATAAWSIDVVKGITLNTDGKGHVTGASVTSGKIPANPNTDEKVKQTESTGSSYNSYNYEMLMSATADSTTRTEGARKSANIKCNPYSGTIMADAMRLRAMSDSYYATLVWNTLGTKQFLLPDDTLASGATSLTLATREYLNSNKYLKNAYSTLSSKTVTNGQSLDLSSFADTDLLYIHFNRYGHQGYVFGFKGSIGGSNGMRILFGNNYFITLSNPSDNTNNLKIQTDSVFPNIVCNVWRLA